MSDVFPLEQVAMRDGFAKTGERKICLNAEMDFWPSSSLIHSTNECFWLSLLVVVVEMGTVFQLII